MTGQPLIYGQGIRCEELQDFICGRCGDVLLQARTVVGEFIFEADGAVRLEDAEHWCDPTVEVPHLLVAMPTGTAAAMEASLPI